MEKLEQDRLARQRAHLVWKGEAVMDDEGKTVVVETGEII